MLFLLPILILLLIFLYFILGFYYQGSFGPNTWINGIYATGQTIEDINLQLTAKTAPVSIIVTGVDGREYILESSDIGYRCDYRRAINQYLKEQNPLLWFMNSIEGLSVQVEPYITIDTELLSKRFETWKFVSEENAKPIEADIELTEAGYVLKDGFHNRYDLESIRSYLIKELEAGAHRVDLTIFHNDMDYPVDSGYVELLNRWEAVKLYQDTGLIYDMGDCQIPLKGAIAAGFILTDENGIVFDDDGKPVTDNDCITTFVNKLAAEYDTYKKDRIWQTHDGRTITVPSGTYGTRIDTEAEINFITENISVKDETIHIPKYMKQGFVRGKNDIGNTYVEVDMTNQKLFVFVDGTCTIETDIVTGNTKRKWSTPDGVYFVYSKQRNRTLRGDNYATPVKYWMPVNGNIGLHDASWRKKFGGEIYKTDGSHGCVNIPKAVMPDIYETVEKGTPVIMYY